MKIGLMKLAAVAFTVAMAAGMAHAQTQGVSKDEIVIGSHLDLSGPAASSGKGVRNGMEMRVDEINAAGGINGRKLRLLVEDTGFNPQRAVSAVQKLVNQDQIFALVAPMGTATSIAAMPIALRKNVFHLFPIASTRAVYEPTNPLVAASVAPTSMEVEAILPRLYKDVRASKPCIIYQDDDFGREVMQGAEAGLKTIGVELATRTGYKRGDTDFSSQMQRLAAEKCDFVVLGTLPRETIASVATARRIGFNPTFISNLGAYSDVTPKLGGAAMDGLYAVMRSLHPYPDDTSSRDVQRWLAQYKSRFNEDPTQFTILGYIAIDHFARAATNAGQDLSVESFTRALNTLVVPPDMFGSPQFSWSPTKRLGSSEFRLSQLQSGRWKLLKDYADFR